MSESKAVLEYNDKGVTLWSLRYPGAFARGETAAEAVRKLPAACRRYRLWAKLPIEADAAGDEQVRCTRKIKVDAPVEEGFTAALFPEEKLALDMARYTSLKTLCLISARDLEALFASIPQKDRALLKSRRTVYGKVPVTAREMLSHVIEAQRTWSTLFGVDLGESQGLLAGRKRLFAGLERQPGYLDGRLVAGHDGELWTLRKLLRRLLWHDALHGRALYRKAVTFWQKERIKNPFGFTK
jgi:hypothetical protein